MSPGYRSLKEAFLRIPDPLLVFGLRRGPLYRELILWLRLTGLTKGLLLIGGWLRTVLDRSRPPDERRAGLWELYRRGGDAGSSGETLSRSKSLNSLISSLVSSPDEPGLDGTENGLDG
jgi:hypothetical protein